MNDNLKYLAFKHGQLWKNIQRYRTEIPESSFNRLDDDIYQGMVENLKTIKQEIVSRVMEDYW